MGSQMGLIGCAVVALVAPHELALGHVGVHRGSHGGGEPAVVALLVVVRLLDVVLQVNEETGDVGALIALHVPHLVSVPQVLVETQLTGGFVVTGGTFQRWRVFIVVRDHHSFRDSGDIRLRALVTHKAHKALVDFNITYRFLRVSWLWLMHLLLLLLMLI